METQGTAYSFASHVDATGTIVLDTNAPASVVSSLTDLSGAPPAQRQAVSRMKLLQSTIVDTWHRRDDIAPYWGGAGITNFSSICSTGYTVEDGAGAELMVTAGHCYATATLVSSESGNNQLGTVTLRRLPTVSGDPRDVELIGGSSYDDNVYTGGVTSTTSADVVAAGTAFVGYTNYCHSGRTTGEACGHTAQSITAQVCTSSGCKSPSSSSWAASWSRAVTRVAPFTPRTPAAACGYGVTSSRPTASPAGPSRTRRWHRRWASRS